MILWKLLLCVLIGLVGHQSAPLFEAWEKVNGRAWPLLGRYSVGGVMILLAVLVLTPKADRERVAKTFMAALVPVGVGVAGGYVVDELVMN